MIHQKFFSCVGAVQPLSYLKSLSATALADMAASSGLIDSYRIEGETFLIDDGFARSRYDAPAARSFLLGMIVADRRIRRRTASGSTAQRNLGTSLKRQADGGPDKPLPAKPPLEKLLWDASRDGVVLGYRFKSEKQAVVLELKECTCELSASEAADFLSDVLNHGTRSSSGRSREPIVDEWAELSLPPASDLSAAEFADGLGGRWLR